MNKLLIVRLCRKLMRHSFLENRREKNQKRIKKNKIMHVPL